MQPIFRHTHIQYCCLYMPLYPNYIIQNISIKNRVFGEVPNVFWREIPM